MACEITTRRQKRQRKNRTNNATNGILRPSRQELLAAVPAEDLPAVGPGAVSVQAQNISTAMAKLLSTLNSHNFGVVNLCRSTSASGLQHSSITGVGEMMLPAPVLYVRLLAFNHCNSDANHGYRISFPNRAVAARL